MAKKWNEYTRREKIIGIFGAVLGVFVIGSFANGVSNPDPSTNEPAALQQMAEPTTTTKEVTESEVIEFDKTTVESTSLAKGKNEVTTEGVNGERMLVYKVTYVDGVETKKELISSEVTTKPVDEVTTVGTYVTPAKKKSSSNCDPNYSGACVPIASDVDCASGNGNGPAYVSGPVYVIGTDIYELDRDGNGVGCE